MSHTFGVLAGDGIGPEVVDEGLKVLRAAADRFGFDYETVDYPYSTDHFLDTGEKMPEEAIQAIGGHSATLLGAIGDPRVEVGMMEFAIIAGLRFDLDLYVNLRPVKLYAERLCPLKGVTNSDLELVIVRENTEGAYAGLTEVTDKGGPNEVSIQQMLYTRKGVERIIRYGYELAMARGKLDRLTLVDKANAIRAQDIWTRVFEEVGSEYPSIEQDHAYVDAACMWMVKNPEHFDVVVTPNLFGDIISDLGAVLQGGMGVAAGGNIHPGKTGVFEPIHGSAPKYTGQGKANPVATVLAVAMMLDFVGEKDAGHGIEQAVSTLLADARIPGGGAGLLPTSDIGDLVVAELGAASLSA